MDKELQEPAADRPDSGSDATRLEALAAQERTSTDDKMKNERDPSSSTPDRPDVGVGKAEEQKPKPAEEPYTVFSKHERQMIVLLASLSGVLSPICSAIFLPAIPAISADLGVSIQKANLLLTVFLIMQGLSPTFWSGIGDTLGRRPTLICTMVVFLAANLGISFADQYGILVFLRCLQAFGSASVIAVGAGMIGDVTPRAKRGSAMALFSMGATTGVSIGPIIGGALSGAAGWHSVFWFLAGFGGAVLIVVIVCLPETLRSIVGNGSIPPPPLNRSLIYLLRAGKHRVTEASTPASPLPGKTFGDIPWLAPVRMLFHPDLLLDLLMGAWGYVLFFLVQTSLTAQLSRTYHLGEILIGVCYLGSGAGTVAAGYTWGRLLDWEYRRVKRREEEKRKADPEASGKELTGIEFPIEKARLRSLFPLNAVLFSACIGYGWALDRHAPLAVIIILTFIIAYCASAQMTSVSTIAVDLFPSSAAAATAALNLCRCLLGAGGTAVVQPLIDAIGDGWTFTIAFGISLGNLLLLAASLRLGPRWRRRREEKEGKGTEAGDRR